MDAVSIFTIVIGALAVVLLLWLFYVLFRSGKER